MKKGNKQNVILLLFMMLNGVLGSKKLNEYSLLEIFDVGNVAALIFNLLGPKEFFSKVPSQGMLTKVLRMYQINAQVGDGRLRNEIYFSSEDVLSFMIRYPAFEENFLKVMNTDRKRDDYFHFYWKYLKNDEEFTRYVGPVFEYPAKFVEEIRKRKVTENFEFFTNQLLDDIAVQSYVMTYCKESPMHNFLYMLYHLFVFRRFSEALFTGVDAFALIFFSVIIGVQRYLTFYVPMSILCGIFSIFLQQKKFIVPEGSKIKRLSAHHHNRLFFCKIMFIIISTAALNQIFYQIPRVSIDLIKLGEHTTSYLIMDYSHGFYTAQISAGISFWLFALSFSSFFLALSLAEDKKFLLQAVKAVDSLFHKGEFKFFLYFLGLWFVFAMMCQYIHSILLLAPLLLTVYFHRALPSQFNLFKFAILIKLLKVVQKIF